MAFRSVELFKREHVLQLLDCHDHKRMWHSLAGTSHKAPVDLKDAFINVVTSAYEC